MTSFCPICYDDDTTTTITLEGCGHSCCIDCLKRWFETEETTGQLSPTCPIDTCRRSILPADNNALIAKVLGRPFVPAGSKNKKRKRSDGVDDDDADDDDEEEEMDLSTKKWLWENTIQCGGCQTPLTKSSGCDKVQCICGFRICWNCRAVNALCQCNPGHGFIDNITGMPSFGRQNQQASTHELRSNLKGYLEEKRNADPFYKFQQQLLNKMGMGGLGGGSGSFMNPFSYTTSMVNGRKRRRRTKSSNPPSSFWGPDSPSPAPAPAPAPTPPSSSSNPYDHPLLRGGQQQAPNTSATGRRTTSTNPLASLSSSSPSPFHSFFGPPPPAPPPAPPQRSSNTGQRSLYPFTSSSPSSLLDMITRQVTPSPAAASASASATGSAPSSAAAAAAAAAAAPINNNTNSSSSLSSPPPTIHGRSSNFLRNHTNNDRMASLFEVAASASPTSASAAIEIEQECADNKKEDDDALMMAIKLSINAMSDFDRDIAKAIQLSLGQRGQQPRQQSTTTAAAAAAAGFIRNNNNNHNSTGNAVSNPVLIVDDDDDDDDSEEEDDDADDRKLPALTTTTTSTVTTTAPNIPPLLDGKTANDPVCLD